MARGSRGRAGQTSPEGLLPTKDGERAPRPASSGLPLLLPGQPNLFSNFQPQRGEGNA